MKFTELQQIFSSKGYIIEKVGKEYHCDDLIFKNIKEALDWIEEPVESESLEQSNEYEFLDEVNECNNDLVVPIVEEIIMPDLNFPISLEVQFSDLKNAVKFFTTFAEKNANAIKISKDGFRYLKAFYQISLEISSEIYVNFEQLKTFVTLYSGKDFSKVTFDFDRHVISGNNLNLMLARVDIKFSDVDENNFSALTKVKSEKLKALTSAASKNKREPELQVINFKISTLVNLEDYVELASTDSSQMYLLNHIQLLPEVVRNIQIKSDIISKFLNFANNAVTFEILGNNMSLQSGKFLLIHQYDSGEFVEYSDMLTEKIDKNVGSWNIRFLEKVLTLIKKIPDKVNSEIKFTNQGNFVNFEVTLHGNLISSGKFSQNYANWNHFSVGTNEFYNLLLNVKDCKILRFSQAEESIHFEVSEKQNLKMILLTNSI